MRWQSMYMIITTITVAIGAVYIYQQQNKAQDEPELQSTKGSLEDDILTHLSLQKNVRYDMLDNEYIQDEIGDVENLFNVYNLALGLYYLSVVQQEGLSDIVETKVSHFIRDGYEAYGNKIVKERESDENTD